MSTTVLLLSLFFLVGLLITGLMLVTRSPRARMVLLVIGLGVVDLGGLAVIFAAFLAARLDGSRPPGLLEFIAGLWAPLALLVLVNAIVLLVYTRRRNHL